MIRLLNESRASFKILECHKVCADVYISWDIRRTKSCIGPMGHYKNQAMYMLGYMNKQVATVKNSLLLSKYGAHKHPGKFVSHIML